MALDPQVEALLAELARTPTTPIQQLTPEQGRRQMLNATAGLGKARDIHSVYDQVIGDLSVRVYRPESAEPLPIVLYFHGGGWVLGSIDTHDGYCRALADSAQAVVVSAEYRLAPEHVFPTAAEDCFAATVWAATHASEIGGDPLRLAVAGDSAGGNLAAAVALMARDRDALSIALQVLIYPITDHDFETASYRELADGYMLTRDAMIWFWDQYCPNLDDRSHPYASPIRASDLAGLAPALVLTAGFDPLRDEGAAYARELESSGVPVTFKNYAGMIHGFTRRFAALDTASTALTDVCDAIRNLGRC